MQGLDCKPSTAQKSLFRYIIELVQQNFWLSLSVSDIARFALRIVFSRLVLLRKNQKFRTEIFSASWKMHLFQSSRHPGINQVRVFWKCPLKKFYWFSVLSNNLKPCMSAIRWIDIDSSRRDIRWKLDTSHWKRMETATR